MQRHFNYSVLLVFLLLMLVPIVALASGSATMTDADGKVIDLAWADDGTLRVDMPDSDGYMIARGGNIYSITMDNGQPRVIEMSNMMQMMRGIAQASGQASWENAQVNSVVSSGETRTVA